ncbi:putative protein OS=Streptomyces albaduncus OX=68172 GN=FHS32_000253 PE=4 SV=1 [Streptomyces griseoloalbus]
MPGGAGAAAKGGAVARTVGALGRTARLVDPMTYLGKAAKFGTVKVSDLFANLRTVNAGAYADLASGAGRVQPDGTVVRVTDDTPVIHDNVVEWPDGTRLNLDDGTVVRADGTAARRRWNCRRRTGSCWKASPVTIPPPSMHMPANPASRRRPVNRLRAAEPALPRHTDGCSGQYGSSHAGAPAHQPPVPIGPRVPRAW